MRPHLLLFAALLPAGCRQHQLQLGDFLITIDKKEAVVDIEHELYGPVLEGMRFTVGQGEAEVEMNLGSFRFEEISEDLNTAAGVATLHTRTSPALIELEDAQGEPLATLMLYVSSANSLALELSPIEASTNRIGWSADCDAEDHFLGAGAHAMDVDHVGQAFPLFVSEPGVGKTEDEELPGDWYQTGTRHASSFPVPFLLRPHRAQGLWLDSTGRVELDLCASDPQRFEALVWQVGSLSTLVTVAEDPVAVLEAQSAYTGRPPLPPPWVFAPWNDAIRGQERVMEVAARLREYEAPSSVIWTEDWKGGEDSIYGYHLLPEWELDRELYPEAEQVAADLEAMGFKWFAYFAPFVEESTSAWEELAAQDGLITDSSGEIYSFLGVPSFSPTSLVDLSDDEARDWVSGKLDAALEIGFDGWMADYAEWLPPEARIDSGLPWIEAHNAYPLQWQSVNLEATADLDAAFFVRSGWAGSAELAPVIWAGDQRTSFAEDDGLPTVVAMGAGLGASAIATPYGHDVAGYQSLGNDPSDKELWFRWASLGAFSPVLRTHHGAFAEDNWQFDSDEETTEHWARVGREHMRLFPYLYGLAHRASEQGTPMLLPPALRYETSYDRLDAWLLGEALLVAPVMERGVDGREVELPGGVDWYDWFELRPATSGWQEAGLEQIPVFAAAGTTVPTLAEIPDTLTEQVSDPEVSRLEDVDDARVVYLFGDGGRFEEADGTVYQPSGQATSSGEATETLTEGTIEVAGLSVEIRGPRERSYRVVVTR